MYMNVTLVKGLSVLESIAKSNHPMGVTELSKIHGIHKSNVHRVLQSLVDMKYVRHDTVNGLYSPSIRLWGLGSAVLNQLDLRQIALPVMDDLLERTRESVHVTVLDGNEIVYVHKLDSPEPVRAYSQIGGRYPAHCVASGKAMLAFLSDEQLLARSHGLKPLSARSIVEPEAFLAEMRNVRKKQYAVNRGECMETVWGVAAPIWNAYGEVLAAIGISGPAERVRSAGVTRLGTMLLAAARDVGVALNSTNASGDVLKNLLSRPAPGGPRQQVSAR